MREITRVFTWSESTNALGVARLGQHLYAKQPQTLEQNPYKCNSRGLVTCFELEQCKQELAIEKRVHEAMDNELEEMEMKWKEVTRLLVEEKANSKLNKEMLHEILNAKGESPLKKNR